MDKLMNLAKYNNISFRSKEFSTIFLKIILICSLLYFLALLGKTNFVLFHSSIELFCVVIAFVITIITVTTHRYNKNNQLLFFGIAYGFIGIFYLFHTLAYQSNIFFDSTGNLTTQLWVIGRYFEGFSLLYIGVLGWAKYDLKTCRLKLLFSIYLLSSLVVLYTLFYLKMFPDAYIIGRGQTIFKMSSEYITILMILMGLFFLYKHRKSIPNKVFAFLALSYICAIFSGFFLLQFFLFTDFTNIIAHIFKFIAFLLIYKAIVETNLTKPYIQLSQSEQMKTNLINMLPIGVFIQDNGKIIYSNPRFIEIIKAKTLKDIIGKSIFDLVSKERHNIIQNRLQNVLEGSILEDIEEKYYTLDNEIIDVRITTTLYPYKSKSATLSIVHDITQSKALEKLQEEIQHKEKQLNEIEKYDNLKTEFFADISHELRTPLNIILGVVQLLIKSHSKLDKPCPYADTFYRHTKAMKQNCYRLLKLINNLIDITKLEAGFMKVNLKYLNIVDLIENITQSVVSFAQSKDISVIFDTEIEEKIMASDTDIIESIMLNLLSNGMKFTDSGGSIQVSLLDKKENIVISVKDTGKGIPIEKSKKIFERYGQVNSILTKKNEGSGIGLHIVKSLIELLNGTISVKSELNKGTEFIISLPANLRGDLDAINEVASTNEINVEKISIEFSDIYS